MNPRSRNPRQIFVLTPEEKKAVCCVIAALVLGIFTQHYRATHPKPPTPPTAKEQRAAKLAQRAATSKAHSARRTVTAATPIPATSEDEED
jgi:hypothetical protein